MPTPARRSPRPAATSLAGASALLLLAACSGGDGGGPGARLSAQEAQAVMGALFAEMGGAMGGAMGGLFSAAPADGGPLATRGAVRAAVELAARSAPRRGVAATPSGTVTADCRRGGKITVAYTESDNTDAAGTGTVAGTLTVTPQGCVVPAGSRTLAVDGDPSLAYSYSGSYVRGAPSGNFVFRGTGGFAWSGGGCKVDYTVTVTPQGAATLSGSACGRSVSGSFTGA